MLFGTVDFNGVLKKIIREKYRHDLYDPSVKHAKDMAVFVYGDTPTDLLKKVRPREDAAVTAYRLDNYQDTVKSDASKAISIVSKILNPSLSRIHWKEQSKSASKLQEYTMEYYPEYNSILEFFREVLLKKMLADPNGLVVAKLEHLPEKQTETPEPYLVIYGSSVIVNYDEDHYLILKHIDPKEKIYHFEYYDAVEYISFTIYNPNEKLFQQTIQEYYQHNFGEIPCWQLRGISEVQDNGKILYKSFFDPARPNWNLSITHESDLIGAFIDHMHPLRYELAEECDYRFENSPCRRGVITLGEGRKMDCPKCEGSGYKSVKSPYGVYKFNKEKLSEQGGQGLDPVGFITVPTEATKMLDERVDKLKTRSMWALSMDVEDKVGENQSGVAKAIDRSAQGDFLYTIACPIFDIHLQNAFYFFNRYMFGVSDTLNPFERKGNNPKKDPNLPEIVKPTTFDLFTTADLINNYQVASKAGVDPILLQQMQIAISNKELASEPEAKKINSTMLSLDPLPGRTIDEVITGMNRGLVVKLDAIIHVNLKKFMDKALIENPDYVEWDRQKQLDKFAEYATAVIEETKQTLDAPVPLAPNMLRGNEDLATPGGQTQTPSNAAPGAGA